uniref:Tail protein n=1 Tax=viral metagenome TaxID=1070528 RepID=A0A6M3IDZ2_9ZZZZ
MLFAGKDGELRLADKGSGGTTYYLPVLFCEMDFTGPTSRPRVEDTLIMDRGIFDSNAHYISGDDSPRYAPLPFSFSARLADTVNSRVLMDWTSGATRIPNAVGGSSTIYSWDGTTTIDGNTLPAFKDDKTTLRVQVLWDGTSDIGLQYNEVYFTPGQQTITESADGLILSANGMIYGDVTRIAALDTSGATYNFV